MGGYKKKGGPKRPGGKFVMLSSYTTNCDAWRDLKPAEVSIYVLIAIRFNGGNNGSIGLSVRDAARLAHVAAGTAQRALEGLQERGFIKCRSKGAFSLKQRHASEWELTCWPPSNGKPATHDYRKWTPLEKQNTVSKRKNYSVKTAEIIALAPAARRSGIIP